MTASPDERQHGKRLHGSPQCILDRFDHGDGKPSVVYRTAGDRFLLIEYGEMEFDLSLNFYAQSVNEELLGLGIAGLVETSPGFRSILISYDPRRTNPSRLINEIQDLHADLPAVRNLVLPSRLLTLPACFDDEASRVAVERYVKSIRPDAPNCENGNNIDYTLQYNGLSSLGDLVSAVTSTALWVGFVGFFPGLPFMFPLDPRHVLFAPKYNPTRTWTAEGAVGLGGPCYSIYPVESPGGYQLLGRTIPIYDIQQRNPAFKDDPILLRAGDRVQFKTVTEPELLATFDAVHAGEYTYEIEDSALNVAEYLQWCDEHRGEADLRAERRDAAAATTAVP